MKKILFISATIATCFLVSCGTDSAKTGSGTTDTEKKNLETARAIANMFEAADWSKTGDYIAADGIDHSGMNGEVKGLDNIKAMFAQMGSMMSDMKNETVKEWADGDYVIQWMKESSTAKMDGMGMKAGQRYTFNTIELSKFKDGKLTDHWGFVDWADAMKMMQSQGPHDMMGKKSDSTGSKMEKK